MKIAIISDSHGAIDRLEQVFSNCQQAGIKHILHAGDFLVDGVVEIFAGFPKLNFFIAIGNNDVNQELLAELKKLDNIQLAEVVFAKFGKYQIAISHYDGIAEKYFTQKDLTPTLSSKERELKENIDIFIHGHTHRPTVVRRGKSTMLNPGALCEDGHYVVLDLETMKGQRMFFSREISF